MSTKTRRQEFIDGAKATLPLIAGAIPFGIIYGAFAVSERIAADGTLVPGLSPAAALAMSLFVFAGSAQFIAAGLVGTGATVLLIVLTTFIVNLRHALYSASLAPFVRRLPQTWLLPLGFWLTDETYAVTIKRYNEEDPSPYKHWFYFGSAVSMYLNWQLCTVIGILAGSQFDDAASWGLDFALVVTFIGIIVPLAVSRPILASIFTAGITAMLFNGLEHKLGLMVAAGCGIAAGYFVETYLSSQFHPPTRQATAEVEA